MTRRHRQTLRKHDQVLQFVKTYTAQKGKPPMLKEIAFELGVGISGVCRRINRLEERGLIERRKGWPASIVVKEANS